MCAYVINIMVVPIIFPDSRVWLTVGDKTRQNKLIPNSNNKPTNDQCTNYKLSLYNTNRSRMKH